MPEPGPGSPIEAVADISGILTRQKGQMDEDYIRTWLLEFSQLLAHDPLAILEKARGH